MSQLVAMVVLVAPDDMRLFEPTAGGPPDADLVRAAARVALRDRLHSILAIMDVGEAKTMMVSHELAREIATGRPTVWARQVPPDKPKQ